MKITQYIKKKLIIIKQTRLWYFFVRFFFIPFFDFIWVNIINFQGRLIAIIFLFVDKKVILELDIFFIMIKYV